MAQLDSDTFTYADGALATVSSGKWTHLSFGTALNVVSERVKNTAGNEGAAVISTWAGSTTEQWSQVTVRGSGAGADFHGPTVLSDVEGTFYFLDVRVGGAALHIYKVVGGSFTDLKSESVVLADGDTVRLEYESGVLTGKINGVTAITVANTDIASGKPGIRCWAQALALDNWAAGDFSVVASTLGQRRRRR